MTVATTAIRRESQIAVHSAGDKSARAAGDTSSTVVSFQILGWIAATDPITGIEPLEAETLEHDLSEKIMRNQRLSSVVRINLNGYALENSLAKNLRPFYIGPIPAAVSCFEIKQNWSVSWRFGAIWWSALFR